MHPQSAHCVCVYAWAHGWVYPSPAHFKSNWWVWDIYGTSLARKFPLWIKPKPSQAKTKNIDKTRAVTSFWATVTCCVSKSMYMSWGIQWQPQISNLNQSKTKQNQNQKYSQSHAYSDMLGIRKHVLELGNLMVASAKSFEWNQNKTLNHKTLKPLN